MKWYRRARATTPMSYEFKHLTTHELFLPYKREYTNQRVCYGRPIEYGTSDLGSMTP
jgi:hypothetical protein